MSAKPLTGKSDLTQFPYFCNTRTVHSTVARRSLLHPTILLLLVLILLLLVLVLTLVLLLLLLLRKHFDLFLLKTATLRESY